MKGILANPNIGPHAKESVLAYYENNLLDTFYTTFFEHSKYPLSNFLGFIAPSLKQEFKRRSFEELPYHFIKSYPFKELMRVFAARKLNPLLTDKIWEWAELSFDKWVASKIHKDLTFIHVYEHGALASLQQAKKLNVKCFYEQPSIHHRSFTEIIKNQLLKYPAFNTKVINLLHDENAVRRNQRRDQELILADKIICNSTFTKNSLIKAGVNENNIITVPLGFPIANETILPKDSVKKIIFMYAGNLSLGKGSHILIEAWKDLKLNHKQAELWLIGKNNLPAAFLIGLNDTIKFINNVPRSDLMKIYQKAHVFIHPTLADGFGMVITEAMSCGLPVIATYNCAGPDIITEKGNGLLIEADNKEAIKNSIIWCLTNQTKLIEMGIEARNKARSYPWSAYRKDLAEQVIKNI